MRGCSERCGSARRMARPRRGGAGADRLRAQDPSRGALDAGTLRRRLPALSAAGAGARAGPARMTAPSTAIAEPQRAIARWASCPLGVAGAAPWDVVARLPELVRAALRALTD